MVRHALKTCIAPLRLAAFLRAEDGIVSVITAIAMFALLGIVALSFDLGRAWNLDTQLQAAADASALVCASQLDGTAGARARATTAATNGALAQNSQNFATDGAGNSVAIVAANVTHYSSYANGTGTVATTDANAAFCKVHVSPRTVNFSFAAAVAGPVSAAPNPSAVARMQTAKCKVPPMMICNPEEPANNADMNYPFDATAHRGQGLTMKDPPNGNVGIGPGNFGLLALNNVDLSANDIRDAWARVSPLAQCFGDQVTTKPGNATSVNQGINVRFDIYDGNMSGNKTNPQYMPATNTVKGYVKIGNGSQCTTSGNNGWGFPPQEYLGPNPPNPVPTSMGFPRDTCAYGAAPTCGPTSASLFGNGTWDIAGYFNKNHPGFASSVVPDLDGNGSISRYEVYQWEIANDHRPSVPVCNTGATQQTPDRRAIEVAVVNCKAAGIHGTQSVDPVSWVKLFLPEAMGTFRSVAFNEDNCNGGCTLYVEVVGPANPQDTTTTKYVLQLVE